MVLELVSEPEPEPEPEPIYIKSDDKIEITIKCSEQLLGNTKNGSCLNTLNNNCSNTNSSPQYCNGINILTATIKNSGTSKSIDWFSDPTIWKPVNPTNNYEYKATKIIPATENLYGYIHLKGKLIASAGNTLDFEKSCSDIIINTTKPTFDPIIFSAEDSDKKAISKNNNNYYLKSGSTFTLTITSSEILKTLPTIKFFGNSQTEPFASTDTNLSISNPLDNNKKIFTVDYTIPEPEPEPEPYSGWDSSNNGLVSFEISNFTDLAGNEGDKVTSTTNGINLYIDTISPTLKITAISWCTDSETCYLNSTQQDQDQTVSVKGSDVSTTELISSNVKMEIIPSNPEPEPEPENKISQSYQIEKGDFTDNNDDNDFTHDFEIKGSDLTNLSDGEYTIKVSLSDLAGNSVTKTKSFTVDTSVPSIEYVDLSWCSSTSNSVCYVNNNNINNNNTITATLSGSNIAGQRATLSFL